MIVSCRSTWRIWSNIWLTHPHVNPWKLKPLLQLKLQSSSFNLYGGGGEGEWSSVVIEVWNFRWRTVVIWRIIFNQIQLQGRNAWWTVLSCVNDGECSPESDRSYKTLDAKFEFSECGSVLKHSAATIILTIEWKVTRSNISSCVCMWHWWSSILSS